MNRNDSLNRLPRSKRARRTGRRLAFRLVYFAVIIAGAIALYVWMPDEVWQTLKETSWDTGGGCDGVAAAARSFLAVPATY